jgi:FkbM family methyltransferase
LRKYTDRRRWTGVLVEPQDRAAEELRKLYRCNDRIIILQAALDRERGRRTFFTVESESAPAWTGMLASFQREHIVKHSRWAPGVESMIRERMVDCVTFDDILARMPDERLGLLQIDAEGADAYLLSLFPFDRVRPPILHQEIKHHTKVDNERCFQRLAGFGYRFALSGGGGDMIGALDRGHESSPGHPGPPQYGSGSAPTSS